MELGDYPPHVYADEGDAGTNFELDAISIPGIPLDPDLVFDDRFRSLAAICGRNGNTANGVRSSPVLQQPQSQHWCEFGRDKWEHSVGFVNQMWNDWCHLEEDKSASGDSEDTVCICLTNVTKKDDWKTKNKNVGSIQCYTRVVVFF